MQKTTYTKRILPFLSYTYERITQSVCPVARDTDLISSLSSGAEPGMSGSLQQTHVVMSTLLLSSRPDWYCFLSVSCDNMALSK